MNSEKLKNIFSQLIGHLYVPQEVLKSNDTKVLHISDTPTFLYPAINNLLATLKPEIIIHTGDLADDIKLGNDNYCEYRYKRQVVPFINMLEQCSAEQVYIVPGNHDDVKVIGDNIKNIIILQEGDIIDTGFGKIGVAHRVGLLPRGVSYNLYGHNFKEHINKDERAVYLNGIKNAHVILLQSGKVAVIPYPMGTNYHRKMEGKYMFPNSI
ncbi:metallophosphoesterase [Desulfofalx alkaliphila]|uniref:metallophosphoesterase n=1 Tax=Desulfofalx alkaliphila TaxID=105483 RepID=UPI00068B5C61|nr:metallophosphoesterase [Desulfofalx alkaliphila]